jgi:hypothetical protein
MKSPGLSPGTFSFMAKGIENVGATFTVVFPVKPGAAN